MNEPNIIGNSDDHSSASRDETPTRLG